MKIRGNTVGTPISVEKIAEKIGGTGGGGGKEALRVVFSMADMTANHTATEISAHVSDGGSVYMEVESMLIPLSHVSEAEGIAYFEAFYSLSQPSAKVQYFVDADGNADARNVYFATTEDIGDISSALDEIREYAESLINGGGSV